MNLIFAVSYELFILVCIEHLQIYYLLLKSNTKALVCLKGICGSGKKLRNQISLRSWNENERAVRNANMKISVQTFSLTILGS